MDDATQGLTALLAGQPTSTAAHTILPEALPPHFWALRSFSWYGTRHEKRKMPRDYLTAWLVCAIFTLLFITNK